MTTTYCPSPACAVLAPPNATECPECGRSLFVKPKRRRTAGDIVWLLKRHGFVEGKA